MSKRNIWLTTETPEPEDIQSQTTQFQMLTLSAHKLSIFILLGLGTELFQEK